MCHRFARFGWVMLPEILKIPRGENSDTRYASSQNGRNTNSAGFSSTTSDQRKSVQADSASPALSIAIKVAFTAPTDVPEIAAKSVTPCFRSALQQPIWYAPFAPPPVSTSPIRFRLSSRRVMKPLSPRSNV